MRASRAIIYLGNLTKNLEAVREKTGPHPKICFPVKTDGYGHGAIKLAKTAIKSDAKVEYLAVAAISEAKRLRDSGIRAKILFFSQIMPAEIMDIAVFRLIPFISDRETIENMAKTAPFTLEPLEIHLKIDTGMGRLGCRPEEAKDLALLINSKKNLKLGGIATHLSVSDSLKEKDKAYTKKQLALFREAADSIRDAGINPGMLHAANSGALCFHDDAYFDMVRPGIFLYGYSPAAGHRCGPNSTPLMELRTNISFIKKVRRGEEISYGRTWKAAEDTFIGTLPIGYGDGLPRLLSNNYSVLIKGKSCPLVGRICMDHCMVDLGNSGEVKRWDEVVVFGPGFSTALDIAQKLNTIPYEILCNINKRIPRVYK